MRSPEIYRQAYRVAKKLGDEMEDELRDFGADASFTGRLALKLSLDLFVTRREWARAARQQLTCAGPARSGA